MPSFSDRLKHLRAERELSQQELSDRLGLNRATYARYETGSTQADYATLEKIADFYDVRVDYLLGRTSDRKDGGGTAPKDPQDAFEQWLRLRGKKEDFTEEEIEKLERKVKNILKELDDELFD